MAQAGSATELHDLLRHGTAWDDALAHLAAHPHLAGVKDGLKRLPLHVALSNHKTPARVSLQLLATGDALLGLAQKVTIDGIKHIKLRELNGACGTVVRYLPESQRYSVELKTEAGAGAARKCLLQRENLKAAKRTTCDKQDKWGRMPLHLALKNGADSAVSLAVLVAFRGAW